LNLALHTTTSLAPREGGWFLSQYLSSKDGLRHFGFLFQEENKQKDKSIKTIHETALLPLSSFSTNYIIALTLGT